MILYNLVLRFEISVWNFFKSDLNFDSRFIVNFWWFWIRVTSEETILAISYFSFVGSTVLNELLPIY